MVLRRPMEIADWIVFQEYAHRVRSVGGPIMISASEPAKSTMISHSVLRALGVPPFFGPLLPNLHTLDWAEGDLEMPFLHNLLTPHMRSLKLRPSSGLSPSALSIISSLASLCPGLKTLDLHVSSNDELGRGRG
ncbi:hypothetical protein HYDPIDRAFT_105022 [Hydnomerulius pinastri MD-312]|nr:hypothetical protein HYDPIDRAFT_105022 [Hydnomerulius pinastri MD-312]